MICVAVLRDHSKREIVAAGDRQERTTLPPPAWCRATPLSNRRTPQQRATSNSDDYAHNALGARTLAHTRGSLGSPNTISPMMLRCTCDEPA